MAAEPLYLRVKRDIAARVADGSWAPGSYIPSEPELQQRYRVSRTTVRKAVDDLVSDGLLTILHGVGTKVVEPRLSLTPATLMSFTQMARARGVEPGRAGDEVTTRRAPADVAAALGLPGGAEVVCFDRVRTADGRPVSHGTSYLPRELFRGSDLSRLQEGESLYTQLEEAFGLVVATTEDTFDLARADAATAARLDLAEGEPLLLILRQAFDRAGHPLEYSRILVRPDRYRHTVTLRRRR
ncbi:MAG: GntR family transcriptional regulator [Propionicimonas sp.]|nr:GntR family transcriptional regulator [Propionicimonas sp.]